MKIDNIQIMPELLTLIDEFKKSGRTLAPECLFANFEIKRFSSCNEQEVSSYAEAIETVFQAWANMRCRYKEKGNIHESY